MCLTVMLFLFVLIPLASPADHPPMVGFKSDPNCERGTVNLLWQCLTTITLCTFTVLHLDIPLTPRSNKGTFWVYVGWITMTIFVPETLLFKSSLDLIAAKRLKDGWNQILPNQMVTLKQAFFITCNGLSIQFLQDGNYVPLVNEDRDFWALQETQKDPKRADVEPLLTYIYEYHLNEAEIDAASKGDALSKLVTCLQAGWMGIQIIARLIEHLDVSLLEVVTANFIIMALVSYGIWYNKPYNIGFSKEVKVPLELNINPAVTDDDEEGGKSQKEATKYSGWKRVFDQIMDLLYVSKDEEHLQIPFFSWLGPRGQLSLVICLVLFLWLGLSAVHLCAWSYEFPTNIEAWMWRSSAITFAATPFVALIVNIIGTQLFGVLPGKAIEIAAGFIGTPTVILYVCARAYIIVEPFISLRSAPAGIYQQVDWTSYWPHIGP